MCVRTATFTQEGRRVMSIITCNEKALERAYKRLRKSNRITSIKCKPGMHLKGVVFGLLLMMMTSCVTTTYNRMYPEWEEVERASVEFGKEYPDSTRDDAIDAFRWGVIWLQETQLKRIGGRDPVEF